MPQIYDGAVVILPNPADWRFKLGISNDTGGVSAVSIDGNTAGVLALISSGTLTLAGGNNITLSQAGNAVTISAANIPGQSVQTQNLFDLTLDGNTAGALALVSSGTLTLAGGNNITLSQAGNAITISGPNSTPQSVQTQNCVDLSLSGNTSGVLALISSGTAILAGGNNITLSQNGQSITISGPNTSSQSQQTSGLFDLTLSGNTSGVLALVSSGTLTLAGGNNITLSQAGNAVTISAFTQTVQTQNLVDITLSGNTSGTLALISSGTLTLAGGNNITLSQVGNAVTISGPNTSSQSVQTQNCVDISLSGNTSGTLALISSGTAILAGGNNVTLSQNGQSITISAFNQTVQTQNLVDITLSGNTSGTLALVSSGTLTLAGGNNVTLSQVGNAITISGPNTVAQTVQTQNCVDLSLSGNTSGTLALISSGTAIFAGGNNITLSQNGQSITISAANSAAQTVQTQNLFDLTLSGNTSGTLALISSGTMTLAGGNNVTLSQVGNAVTVSAANQTVESQSIGMSNLGNTSGTTGIASGGQVRFLFAGGNNITLSQSLNGASGTITVNGPNIAVAVQTAGISNLGNTSGTSGVITGAALQVVFAGGNNITLSQSLTGSSVTITISAFSQSVQTQNLIDLSLSGNTTGTLTLISSGTAILAGGNNITLSQNGQSITISAFNQSVQTQNLIDLSLSGNTTGTLTLISSGTAILAGGNNITLSQNGQSVTISAFNQSVQTQNALNVTLAGNTTGTLALISSGTMTLAGGDNITLSQNGNAITIKEGLVRSYFHNIDVPSVLLLSEMGVITISPLLRDAGVFIGNMTVSTAYLGISMSAVTSIMSAAQTFSISYGLYTLNGVSLSLVNSVSTSFGWAAATNASTKYAGQRVLSFHSSQWSSTPVMSYQKYWQALGWSNQNSVATGFSISQMGSGAGGINIAGIPTQASMSGTIGVSQVNDTASTKGYIFMYGVISTTAFPANIQNSQLSKSNITRYNLCPYVQFNNLLTDF
jgi:hypothetical protein